MRERLYRSRSDRMLFGVAGGMADYFDFDPSIVRLVWALLLFTGIGFLLYLVAAVVIPEEPLDDETAAADPGAAGGAPLSGESSPTVPVPAGTAPNQAWGAATPRQARQARRAARRDASGSNGAIVFGVVLVVAGGWFLAQQLFPALNGALFWPGLLIVLGLVFVIGAMRGRDGQNRP
jgi:phage shock protein C